MTRTCDVAIVGGGIGGLTLAIGLAQGLLSVQIYEQDIELREIGPGSRSVAMRRVCSRNSESI
jgi:2-polyprenyl-6-methoxyphenol hydroxylase-like FAD-dependent oxidoreductase